MFSIVVVYQFHVIKFIISYLLYCEQRLNSHRSEVMRLNYQMKVKSVERNESIEEV